jgi:N-acetylglucosamine malate deacetylase 1
MTTVDVLAIGAHPDDVEVGCGGAIALCAEAGVKVAIADLTAGELSTRGTPEQRRLEAQSAAAILGVVSRIVLGLPDGSVGTDASHQDELVRLLRTLRPRIVLAPYHLMDRHPDHAATGRLVRDAAFFAGVGRRGIGEPHRPERVYHYMLHHMFTASFVIDISAVWAKRTDAIAAYRSQFDPRGDDERDIGPPTAISGPEFVPMWNARAQSFGAMIGATYGEAYYCEGPLGLGQLPGLERPNSGPFTYRAFL